MCACACMHESVCAPALPPCPLPHLARPTLCNMSVCIHVCGGVHARYDYQAADLGSMLEILACIKGVACLLQQANIWMSGYLYQAVYLQMQTFVQLAMTHTDPRNKVRTPLHPSTPHMNVLLPAPGCVSADADLC